MGSICPASALWCSAKVFDGAEEAADIITQEADTPVAACTKQPPNGTSAVIVVDLEVRCPLPGFGCPAYGAHAALAMQEFTITLDAEAEAGAQSVGPILAVHPPFAFRGARLLWISSGPLSGRRRVAFVAPVSEHAGATALDGKVRQREGLPALSAHFLFHVVGGKMPTGRGQVALGCTP